MLVSGGVITYGSYRLLQFLNRQSEEESYEQFMQREDVEATLQTLRRFLNTKKKIKDDPYKELRCQFVHVEGLLNNLKKIIDWRKEKIYRYVFWSGESKKLLQFKDEWAILMSRLRLIKALLYLDKHVF